MNSIESLLISASTHALGIDVSLLISEITSGKISQELAAGETIATEAAKYIPAAAQIRQALVALTFINSLMNTAGIHAKPATVEEMEAIHPAFNPNAGN